MIRLNDLLYFIIHLTDFSRYFTVKGSLRVLTNLVYYWLGVYVKLNEYS